MLYRSLCAIRGPTLSNIFCSRRRHVGTNKQTKQNHIQHFYDQKVIRARRSFHFTNFLPLLLSVYLKRNISTQIFFSEISRLLIIILMLLVPFFGDIPKYPDQCAGAPARLCVDVGERWAAIYRPLKRSGRGHQDAKTRLLCANPLAPHFPSSPSSPPPLRGRFRFFIRAAECTCAAVFIQNTF